MNTIVIKTNIPTKIPTIETVALRNVPNGSFILFTAITSGVLTRTAAQYESDLKSRVKGIVMGINETNGNIRVFRFSHNFGDDTYTEVFHPETSVYLLDAKLELTANFNQ